MAKIRLVTDEFLHLAMNDIILATKKTLVLIFPSLSKTEPILERLADLREKDVKIYVITRKSNPDPSHHVAITVLEKMGCFVFLDDLVRAKVIISDQGQLLVSSASLSKTANDRSYDVGVVTNDKGTINKALDYAEKIMQIVTKRKKKKEQS
ncbi:MAG: phospholipase D-like domain-containing protein [Candidatus Odinarchaeia archaeon]